jgi:hypothetical protein
MTFYGMHKKNTYKLYNNFGLKANATWFAKSATECTSSASITWLEVARYTPNFRENTRKLHHNAVVTALWLEKKIKGKQFTHSRQMNSTHTQFILTFVQTKLVIGKHL